MHEAHLIADLMRRIDRVADETSARRITGVRVWLGALSHLSADHFTEHFVRAAAGTKAQGARLDITVCDDMNHADAQGIVLKSVEVEL
jgi:hydrogenase nickel incorporation protein HypA/HybF